MKKIGMNLTKVSLRHHIAEEIRKAIFERRLKLGDKITETQISNEVRVSRGPVREAMQILELEGLLISTPYKETRVANITKEEITELLIPIRQNIESFAYKRAYEQLVKTDFQEFESILVDMKKAADYEDLTTIADLDIRFHEVIIKAADIEGVLKIWGSIVNRIRLHFLFQGKPYENYNQIVTEHRTLLEAFRSGNMDLALKELVDHINDC